MSEIILHHYDASPFSEKIRGILGYKKLAWRSVTTPFILPKPDLMPLTGGYRKAPVMQIGRDVYCDTSLMARVIDRLHSTPALIPAALKASCAAFANLEQTLFFTVIPVNFQPAGLKYMAERMGGHENLEKFSKDRGALFAGGTTPRPNAEFSKARFLPLMSALDSQLAGESFLLGTEPTLADFCVYHPVWFILMNKGVAGNLGPFRNLLAWAERVKSIGHGTPAEITAEQALEVSRTATQGQPFDGPVLEPDGVKIGQTVQVNATDYGVDPVQGVLVHASVFELVVKRSDERAGEVNVHFPRTGFRVSAV